MTLERCLTLTFGKYQIPGSHPSLSALCSKSLYKGYLRCGLYSLISDFKQDTMAQLAVIAGLIVATFVNVGKATRK